MTHSIYVFNLEIGRVFSAASLSMNWKLVERETGSWLLQLGLLLAAISFALISVYRRGLVDKSAQKTEMVNGKPLLERNKAPNFGFGEIRVSKILIHPIKVRQWDLIYPFLFGLLPLT